MQLSKSVVNKLLCTYFHKNSLCNMWKFTTGTSYLCNCVQVLNTLGIHQIYFCCKSNAVALLLTGDVH